MASRVVRPELKALVAEASRALACLDTPRLEELAASCAALNRAFEPMSAAEEQKLACEAREAAAEMRVFAHVLEATRANLRVMKRLSDLRMGRLEYGERESVRDEWSRRVNAGRCGNGDD